MNIVLGQKEMFSPFTKPDVHFEAALQWVSRYLSKKFKSELGMGLPDYISQYRVRRAEEMLIGSQDSIQRIAEACGFLNINTFIRVFKKLNGITPGQFREIRGSGRPEAAE